MRHTVRQNTDRLLAICSRSLPYVSSTTTTQYTRHTDQLLPANIIFFKLNIYSTTKTEDRCLEDRELNQARSKPDPVDSSVRTAHTFVHHYNDTQYVQINF